MGYSSTTRRCPKLSAVCLAYQCCLPVLFVCATCLPAPRPVCGIVCVRVYVCPCCFCPCLLRTAVCCLLPLLMLLYTAAATTVGLLLWVVPHAEPDRRLRQGIGRARGAEAGAGGKGGGGGGWFGRRNRRCCFCFGTIRSCGGQRGALCMHFEVGLWRNHQEARGYTMDGTTSNIARHGISGPISRNPLPHPREGNASCPESFISPSVVHRGVYETDVVV